MMKMVKKTNKEKTKTETISKKKVNKWRDDNLEAFRTYQREYQREYQHTPKQIEYRKNYYQKPEVKAKRQTPEYKEKQKLYHKKHNADLKSGRVIKKTQLKKFDKKEFIPKRRNTSISNNTEPVIE